MRLWKRIGGEPYLVNPHLIVTNPRHRRRKKRGVSMRRARDSKGRFLPRGNPRHKRYGRRGHRRNPVGLAAVGANPRRHHRRSHRRHRSNPPGRGLRFIGTQFPLKTIGQATAGFVATPLLEGFVGRFIPAQLSGNIFGNLLVKAGSVAGVAGIARAVLGRDAARNVAVGGGVYVLGNLVSQFIPQIIGGGTLGYYSPGQKFGKFPYPTGGIRRIGSQPMLGKYFGKYPGLRSAVTANTPERLNPASRF